MRLLFEATAIVVAILFAFNLFTITSRFSLWHFPHTLSIANYFIVATLFPRHSSFSHRPAGAVAWQLSIEIKPHWKPVDWWIGSWHRVPEIYDFLEIIRTNANPVGDKAQNDFLKLDAETQIKQ